jgi:glycosyltransferase involved in cell wall biosynthesis
LGAKVEFAGFAHDQLLAGYYLRAKALLFPGVEDFGIVPVEAIAAGCPVIAFKKGGVLDSMTEQTAVFYKEQSEDGLSEGIRRFEATQSRFDESVLRQRAALFSEAAFLKGFERLLDEALSLRGMPASNPGRGQTIATPASFFQDTA